MRPDQLFVYGTLCPGQAAWPMLAPLAIDEPAPSTVRGLLYDTGLGYPALVAGDGVVPGWTVRLGSPAEALVVLDEYEGPQYDRIQTVDSAGRTCWTYRWCAPMTGLTPLPQGWPAR